MVPLHFLLADKSVFETQKISSDKQLKNFPTLQQGIESVTSAAWSFSVGKSVHKVASACWILAITHQQVGVVALKWWCFNRNE
jgi:hypothetical protein